MTTSSTCPLCGERSGAEVLAVPYEAVWDRLGADWTATITPETRSANEPESIAHLIRCTVCGLERFDPLAPGDATFYRELMAAMPYNPERWEFGVVARALSPDDDVLDLGCGEGAFLRRLGSRSGRTVGLDHNGPAIDRLAAAGIEAQVAGFGEFAAREAGRFDVVTAFHLLEHIDDPVAAVRAGASCLRPSGRMFLSVPNRERSYRSEIEPLDCPPHHVTRWSADQLVLLAGRCGLAVAGVSFEPPDLSVSRELSRRSAEKRAHRLPPRARTFVGKAWGRVATGPRRHRSAARRHAFARRGVFGHAVLVELTPEGSMAEQVTASR